MVALEDALCRELSAVARVTSIGCQRTILRPHITSTEYRERMKMHCHSHGKGHHGQKWNKCNKLKRWNQGSHKAHGHCKFFASSSDARILMHKKHMHHHHKGGFHHNMHNPCQRHSGSCLERIRSYHDHHAHRHHCHGNKHICGTPVEGSTNAPQPSQPCSHNQNRGENCNGNKTMVDKAVNTCMEDTETENGDNNLGST